MPLKPICIFWVDKKYHQRFLEDRIVVQVRSRQFFKAEEHRMHMKCQLLESWTTNTWIKKQTKTAFNRQKYALLKNKIQEISMLQGISKIILWKYLIQEPLSKIMFCLIFWSCSTHHSFSVTKRPSNF